MTLHGIAAAGLVDAHRPRRAHTMAVQEHHDFADRLLLGPGGRDAAGSYRTDAVHLPQRYGCASMMSNTLSAKARRSFLA